MKKLNEKLFEIEYEFTELLSLLRIMDYGLMYCEENGIKNDAMLTLQELIIKKAEAISDMLVVPYHPE